MTSKEQRAVACRYSEPVFAAAPPPDVIGVLAARLQKCNPQWSEQRVMDRAYIEACKVWCPERWTAHFMKKQLALTRKTAKSTLDGACTDAGVKADEVRWRGDTTSSNGVTRHVMEW